MPAYNFQRQFVPMILDGSKVHTIRRRRKRPTRVGDTLSLYVGMRTRECRLIAVTECVRVEPVAIYPFRKVMMMRDCILSPAETRLIATQDGFEDAESFFAFFERYGKATLRDFEIVWWDLNLVWKWDKYSVLK